jgi:hypothetical protein
MDIAVKKLELLDWIMHLEDTAVFKKLLEMKESTKELKILKKDGILHRMIC